MNTPPASKDRHLLLDPWPMSTRVSVGAVACLIAVSTAVMTSAPGWAAPRPKPTSTPAATSTPPPSPSPTGQPTPGASPAPTSSPTPTTPPAPACLTTSVSGTATYCAATFTDITAGSYAVGTRVAISGTWVLDVTTASQVTLGRNECPPGMYCGATLVTVVADFSQAQPTPPLDGSIDVYGTVTPEGGIHVDSYR